MIVPRKVKFEAKKRENENIEFRTFLKCNADEKELDEQFKKLHEELFVLFGKLNAAVSIRLKRVFQST